MKREREFDQLMAGKAILKKIIPSTPASAADLVGTYQVFLSFRGKDTRSGFTDHLYHNLVGAGVHTFRDDNELRVGEEIGPELMKAIKDSKISIPIFSKHYADSKWCLCELTQMVECWENEGQKIYPIFYDVEPSEVQHHQRGSYNDAFVKYENDPSLDQRIVEQWKKALAIVGELKGFELKKETNGLEGELVKTVVKKVFSELKKNNMHLPETLVGIDNHIENMKGLLNSEPSSVRIVGIVGMSGVGKTTIAKAIYNELNALFDSHCFLEDVRGESQRHDGLLHLQNQLHSKILNREIHKIRNVDEGTGMIKDAIHGKKVFLVLDNVDDLIQIKKLAVNHNWYGEGSRIIITATNEEGLLEIKKTCEEEGHFEVYRRYELELMGEEDALKLFSKCAFKRDSPPEGYLNLAKEVVSIAGGLPLVLETLGSLLLIEKDNKVSWEAKLKQLKETSPKKVLERLRISYDALDFHEKEIFLDISCFFIGVHKRDPVYMWDACGFHPLVGIEALVRRSLIKVREDDNILRMHDRLQELGKRIEKDNPRQSRLWDHGEALESLETHMGLKNVEALRLNFDRREFFSHGAPIYPRLAGEDFAKLRQLRYLSVNSADLVGDFKGLHSKLRWLEWQGGSGNSTPTHLSLKNLVILNLSKSSITDNSEWWSQIKMAEKLKVLNLSYCNLSKLDCSTFKDLESLNLHSCKSLLKVSGLEWSVSVTNLKASECASLRTLGNLSNLKKLKKLDISYCLLLTEIQGLEKLESLEHLYMMWCNCIVRLPDLSNLRMLKKLFLSNWDTLLEVKGLGGLASLEHLDMSWWDSMERLPGLLNLRMLKKLVLNNCIKLREIDGLSGLVSLAFLNMMWCESIVILPDLSNLRRLKKLILNHCRKLREVGGLGGLVSLEILDMRWCDSVEILPDLSNLGKLKTLDLHSCWKLREIKGLRGLVSLESLDFSDCESLGNSLNLSYLKNLKELTVCSLMNRTKIWGLEKLKSLEVLDVSGCVQLQKLPDLSKLTNFKKLNAKRCWALREIQGLEELKKRHCWIQL